MSQPSTTTAPADITPLPTRQVIWLRDQAAENKDLREDVKYYKSEAASLKKENAVKDGRIAQQQQAIKIFEANDKLHGFAKDEQAKEIKILKRQVRREKVIGWVKAAVPTALLVLALL